MRFTACLFSLLLFLSCNDDAEPVIDVANLADYIALNDNLERDEVIACAGGRLEGLFDDPSSQSSIIFYPIEGASDFRYFESASVLDSLDHSAFITKDLDDDALFNGYLRKFNNTNFEGERVGIVTFLTDGTLHISNPIRLKTNVKPTEVTSDLVSITDNGVQPTFVWQDGIIDETAIYFQVVSDEDGNLISGTYTFDNNFTFYDLENVVLNITDTTSLPFLVPNRNYTFTMMGVSEDNWVNLFIQRDFSTN